MDESYYSANGGSLRTRLPDDSLDPMASVANLSDAMLVFACGLLIALVVAWNVDLGAVTQVEIDQSQQIENLDSLEDMLEGAGTDYVQRGVVYEDPNTGTLYLLEDGGAGSGPNPGSAAGSGSDGNASGNGGASANGSAPANGSGASGALGANGANGQQEG